MRYNYALELQVRLVWLSQQIVYHNSAPANDEFKQ